MTHNGFLLTASRIITWNKYRRPGLLLSLEMAPPPSLRPLTRRWCTSIPSLLILFLSVWQLLELSKGNVTTKIVRPFYAYSCFWISEFLWLCAVRTRVLYFCKVCVIPVWSHPLCLLPFITSRFTNGKCCLMSVPSTHIFVIPPT
jgi:hypothetical protein